LFDHDHVIKPTADKFASQLVSEGLCLRRLTSEDLGFFAASFFQVKQEKRENLLQISQQK